MKSGIITSIMHVAFQRLLGGCLKLGINILNIFPQSRGGAPRPLTEAEIAARRDPSRLSLPLRVRSLGYKIPKAHITRIFQLGSAYYIDAYSRGLEVRNMVGQIPVQADEVHGYGDTSVWHQDKGFDVFINIGATSPMNHRRGFLKTIGQTLKHIPTALIHAKKLVNVGGKAMAHDMPGTVCTLSIVGRTPYNANPAKLPVFAFYGTHLDGRDNHTVILHDVFKPVADPQSGDVVGMTPIHRTDKNREIEVLRTLIFCKLITDQMRNKTTPDLKRCFAAANALSLKRESKLQDYLTYQLPDHDGP
jgi:hypothetical protein